MAKKAPKISEEYQQLKDVAEVMSATMYADPEKEGIDLELEEEELREAIEELAKELTLEDKDDDDMTEEVWAWLEEEGLLDHLKPKKGAKGKAAAKGKKEEEPEEELEEEEKPAAKGKGKAAPAKEETKEKSSKKGKIPAGFVRENTISRTEAVGKVLIKAQKGITLDDLISKSDALFADNGGKANEKEQKTQVDKAVKLLVAMELYTLKGDKLTPA